MKSVSETEALEETIRRLKQKRKDEWVMLKEQAHLTYEELKPINLLKRTLQQIAGSTEIKNNLASTLFALAAGFLSKRALMGVSNNPSKKIAGTLFQLGIAKFISSNAGTIKLQLEKLLLRILKPKNKVEHEFSHNGHQ